jgi:hypothetical protein
LNDELRFHRENQIELRPGLTLEEARRRVRLESIMLGVRSPPVRVFIDPDPDPLITTNTNAGTTLKQVTLDKSIPRHLGSALPGPDTALPEGE